MPGNRDLSEARDHAEIRVISGDFGESPDLDRAFVGHLVRGITHDLNNALGVILNYAQFVEEAVVEGPVADDIRIVARASQRAVALTASLEPFTERELLADAKVMDVRAAVEGLEPVLAKVLGADAKLVLDLEEGPPAAVALDAPRLECLLTHLVRNAAESGALLVVVVVRQRSGWVELVVSDDGRGMDARTCTQAALPFFTTKARGLGAGLGLAAVTWVVERVGGRVLVESTPAVGTTVRLLMPVCA